MRILFISLFFTLSLAQSFTGTYTALDNATSTTFTLKLIENPDRTLTGNFVFDTVPVMVSGKLTAPGQADGVLMDEAGGFAFTLTLTEPNITLKASDTGDEITLARTSSDIPTIEQIDVSQIEGDSESDLSDENNLSNEPLSEDPKFEECLAILEDEQSDPQQVQDCQTYINSMMSQATIEEGTGSEGEYDPEEIAYCQEFLADAEAVADDPDEANYCQSYIATYGNSATTPQPTFNSSPDTSSNPLASSTSSFSGSFRGNDIALTLQGRETYTGTLEFQGKTYPVQANSQDNLLKGTFNVNGTDFEFTAVLDGMTLTLESGGNSYPMMKDPASQ